MKKIIWISLAVVMAGAFIYILVAPGASDHASGEGRYALLDDSSFARETAGKFAFVYFTADWCPPCRVFAPVFAEVTRQVREGFFVKVDVDTAPDTSTRFGVRSIPYIIAVKDGTTMAEYSGNRTAEDFTAWCRNQLKEHGD
jgi:thiol-disulfide isomerase/thioredoxin